MRVLVGSRLISTGMATGWTSALSAGNVGSVCCSSMIGSWSRSSCQNSPAWAVVRSGSDSNCTKSATSRNGGLRKLGSGGLGWVAEVVSSSVRSDAAGPLPIECALSRYSDAKMERNSPPVGFSCNR